MKAASVHVILLFEIRVLVARILFEKATPANFSTLNYGGTNTMNRASIYIRSKGTEATGKLILTQLVDMTVGIGIHEISSKWY